MEYGEILWHEIVVLLILPMYFNNFSKGFALFVVGHMTYGEMLATMFIVNHVIEGAAFTTKNDAVEAERKIEEINQLLLVVPLLWKI